MLSVLDPAGVCPWGHPSRMLWAGSGLPAHRCPCVGTSSFSSVTQADSLLLIHSGQGAGAVVSSSGCWSGGFDKQKVASCSGCEQHRVL